MTPKPKGENGTGGNGNRVDNDLKAVGININEVVWMSIKNVFNSLQITGIFLGLLFLYNHHPGCIALAASGGRMGGSSFSSSSTSPESYSSSSSSSYPSSSSSESSYSSSSWSSSSESPSSSSSWSSSESPSSSWSSYESPSSSSSWSSSESPSSSWSSYESPKSSFSSWSSFSDSESPDESSFSSWWTSSSSESPKSSSSETPKKSSTTSSKSPKSSTTPLEGGEFGEAVGVDPAVAVKPVTGVDILIACGMIALVVGLVVGIPSPDTLFPKKTSVLKLQVGFSGKGRSLQMDLNRIAETADSSSPEGLSRILKETTRALLRYPDHCISGFSSVDAKKSILEVEKLFNQLSIEERSKFDEETLVNVNNIKKKSATTQSSNDISNEYIVVTIIVAAEGVHKLPPINSSSKLKEALQKLMTVSSSSVKAVDVLWTPQKENDILTEQEYLEDYPLLRPL